MVFEITRSSGVDDPEHGPLNVAGGYQRNRSLAKALDRASYGTFGIEIDDYSSASNDVVGILPADATIVAVKVFQDANDDGTAVTDVDVTDGDGTSILSSALALADSGGSQVNEATLGSTTEFDEDTVIIVDVDGDSDDTSPPGGYVEVVYKLTKNRYVDPTA